MMTRSAGGKRMVVVDGKKYKYTGIKSTGEEYWRCPQVTTPLKFGQSMY